MSIISEMLIDMASQGFNNEEIKNAVISILSPYFENQDRVNCLWCTPELLSAFEFFIRYHYEHEFEGGISEVLSLYKSAFKQNPEQTSNIICGNINAFSQKENIMWTVRGNIANINDGDLYEKAVKYMRHIGDILEVGTKPMLYELWALIQILNGKEIDYEKILCLDFGVILQNIRDKSLLELMLVPQPISIKLSDWRNIARHDEYEIINEEKIKCTYGKGENRKSFMITENELLHYTHKIVLASNILHIARYIFINDFGEMIGTYNNTYVNQESKLRSPIIENRLRISMLSQGFYLRNMIVSSQIAEAEIIDLYNDGTLTKEKIKKRCIHSSQFLFNIWCEYKKEQNHIKYMTSQENLQFSCSVEGKVCEKIYSGEKELEYMENYLKYSFS